MEKSIFTPEYKRLQELLRQIRLGAGLRQEDLAALLGEDQWFVSRYENGETKSKYQSALGMGSLRGSVETTRGYRAAVLRAQIAIILFAAAYLGKAASVPGPCAPAVSFYQLGRDDLSRHGPPASE